MTPIVRRLKTRQQFLKVAGTRRKWVAPGLILQCRQRALTPGDRPSSNLDQPSPTMDGETDLGDQNFIGLGFTVSRKVGNAVQRNRARRRLRAASDIVLATKGRPGFDYVLIGRHQTLNRGFQDLLGDLTTALERLKKGPPSSKERSKTANKSKSAGKERRAAST